MTSHPLFNESQLKNFDAFLAQLMDACVTSDPTQTLSVTLDFHYYIFTCGVLTFLPGVESCARYLGHKVQVDNKQIQPWILK